MFWLKFISAYAIILGVQGASLTDIYLIDIMFRMLFIAAGILRLFNNKFGIYLLVLGFFLSVPDVEIGQFSWAPVKLMRLTFGFNISEGTHLRLGIDWLSAVILSRLSSYINK